MLFASLLIKFGPTEQKLAAYAAPFVLLALLLVMVLVRIQRSRRFEPMHCINGAYVPSI
jgi:hypothetical protein